MDGNARKATEGQKLEIIAAIVKASPRILKNIVKNLSHEAAKKWIGDQKGLERVLIEAGINALMPEQMKELINIFPISVNYFRSVEDGIKAGNYDWKNDDITSKNFPSQEIGTKDTIVELFHYGKDMSTYEVLSDLDKQGYRPATLKELLALGEKYPNLQREFLIFALGSVCLGPLDNRYCPYLYGDGSERVLNLSSVDERWHGHCRFAAVRK